MSLMQRLFRRESPPETTCPRCATLVPAGAVECAACGWDLRESYHGEPAIAGPDAPARRGS